MRTKTDKQKEKQTKNYQIEDLLIMLPDRTKQDRLAQELNNLCPEADIRIFTKEDELLQAAKELLYPVIFLGEVCGTENDKKNGIETGKSLIENKENKQGYCNLIYVTDTTDTRTLKDMWEMHVSGILPPDFSEKEIRAELDSLRRYPLRK